jgi:hypothetical protein
MAQPNPYEQLTKNQEKMAKEHPELQELGRLCYSTFETHKDGKELLDKMKDRFVNRSLVNPTTTNASEQTLYWTGYADCLRFFMGNISEHKQRITACQD